MKFIERQVSRNIENYLKHFPAVAIFGPRQCGKSTLAKSVIKNTPDSLYLDLEDPDDLVKLEEPSLFFKQYGDKLICLDEIQRVPELFPLLRSVIDRQERNGQFLILGSASPDLIKQSSETLAGRIIYQELTPFIIPEIPFMQDDKLNDKYWIRGGFPRSYLAENDMISNKWRKSFIATFLERDIPNLGIYYPPAMMKKLWQMLAHIQGQLINYVQLGNSLGVSHTMVRNYLEVLHQTYMIRILKPYQGNLKKRLVKTPKVYIRDTGILHSLLNIENFDMLYGHPVAGASWETLVIENILGNTEGFLASFFRTSGGNEIDLILEKGNKRYAVECKLSSSPKLTAGFYHAVDELETEHTWVVAPVDTPFMVKKNITITPLNELIKVLNGL